MSHTLKGSIISLIAALAIFATAGVAIANAATLQVTSAPTLTESGSFDDYSADSQRMASIDVSGVTLADLLSGTVSYDIDVISNPLYAPNINIYLDNGDIVQAWGKDWSSTGVHTVSFADLVSGIAGYGATVNAALGAANPIVTPNTDAQGNYFDTASLLADYGTANVTKVEVRAQADAAGGQVLHVVTFTAGGATNYYSIQAAVDDAQNGDSVNVAAGTYLESVVISKSLTLSGGSGTSPVIAGDGSSNFILKVNGVSGGVTIDNFEVNGQTTTPGSNNYFYGVWINDSGTSGTPVELKNLTVKNVWSAAGANGIEVDAASVGGSYATIHDNQISSFQKRGIRFLNSSGKVYANNVTGDNVDGSSRVQNLVNLWGGSTVEIFDNQLHNALTTGLTPTWDSPAIFVSSYDGGTNSNPSSADIHDNTIYSDDTGVTLGSYYVSGTDASTATVTNNTFHDVVSAINLEKGDVVATVHNNFFGTNVTKGVNSDDGFGGPSVRASVNATQNWWGDASGPHATTNSNGAGAAVYDEVSFTPWFKDSGMTQLQYPVVANTTDARTTTDTTITGTSTTPSGTVEMTIDSGTTIIGSTSWDGTVNAPTVVSTVTPTVAGQVATPVLSIEVGDPNSSLTFSNPVRLVFAGQAGKEIGWQSGATGAFTPISTVCTSDSAAGLSITVNDCKIDVNGDLVVWTRHFSTFTVYTQVAAQGNLNNGSSGNSGSGSGNGPVASGGGAPAASTPATASTGSVDAGGEVLGAATYNFAVNLTVGSRGTDVTELQKVLIAEGFFSGEATGYFGSITKAAVMKYQKAHGLPATGFVGAMTRAELNKGSTPTMSDEQKSLLIQSLQTQLKAFTDQLQVLMKAQATTTVQ